MISTATRKKMTKTKEDYIPAKRLKGMERVAVLTSLSQLNLGRFAINFWEITPQAAAEMFTQLDNSGNRPESKRNMHKYREAMERGRWKASHQGIAISPTGKLLDGQTRIRAIIETKRAQIMPIATGMSAQTFRVMDSGKRRGGADTLATAGFSDYASAAAVARIEMYFQAPIDEGPGITQRRCDNESLLQAARSCEPYLGEAQKIVGSDITVAIKHLIPRSSLTWYVMKRLQTGSSDSEVQDWVNGLALGVGVTDKNDPRIGLMKRMRITGLISQKFGGIARSIEAIYLLHKCWQACHGELDLKKYALPKTFGSTYPFKTLFPNEFREDK